MLYTLFYKLLFLSTHTVHHDTFPYQCIQGCLLHYLGCLAFAAVVVQVCLISPPQVDTGFFLLLVAQSLPTALLFHLGSFLEVRFLARRVCVCLRLHLPERSLKQLTIAGVVGRGGTRRSGPAWARAGPHSHFLTFSSSLGPNP